jgi:membrane-associated phospholipid phosphatase
MKLHDSLQRGVEKLFFKNKSTIWSKRITYMIGNVILMLILFYVLLNTIAYDWTGSLYPEGTGYRLDWVFGGLDNLIPFVPEMALFYVFLFYSMAIITMIYFGFFASDKGYALGWSLVLINFIAIIIYIFFPVSTHWWRLELLAEPLTGNPWAELMYGYYSYDTSFNCFPSLHAAVSTALAYTWYRYSKTKPSKITIGISIVTIIIAIGVILSTLFVKQHYIADEIAGVVSAYVVAKYTFKKFWKSFEKPVAEKMQ